MDEIQLVIGFFINKPGCIVSSENILMLSDFVSKFYKMDYTNFSYCETQENGKSKTKSFKYTEKNIDKFASSYSSNITAIGLYKLKNDNSYLNTDLLLEYLLTDKNDIPITIHIILDAQMIDKFCSDHLISLADQIKKFGLDLQYGIAFLMERKKMPSYFLSGMQTPELREEERKIANALSLNIREYRNKVWDIFWYNIIKKNLINESMLKKIEQIVEKDNIIEFDDKYIIRLPVAEFNYLKDEKQYNTYQSKLRKIFQHNDSIMYSS